MYNVDKFFVEKLYCGEILLLKKYTLSILFFIVEKFIVEKVTCGEIIHLFYKNIFYSGEILCGENLCGEFIRRHFPISSP